MKWRVRATYPGPCHEHILEIAQALGRRVVASASSLLRHALQRRCIFDSLGKIRLQFRQRSGSVPSGHRLPEGGEAGHFRCAISP